MAEQTPQPVAPLPSAAPAPAPVPWYFRKGFVVLVLILFFPAGLVLLWRSPATKLSGRIVWTALFALAVLGRLAGGGSSSSPPTAEAPKSVTTPVAAGSTNKPAPDPYNFTFTDKNSGTAYKGKVASNVGVAVLQVAKAQSVGTNPFMQKSASSGATFVVVRLAVQNDQKDAITMDGSTFKLLAGGKEYSHSSEGQMALMADEKESFFLKQINPGLTAVGSIVFEVPDSFDMSSAQLQFRGGFTGKADTLPLKTIKG